MAGIPELNSFDNTAPVSPVSLTNNTGDNFLGGKVKLHNLANWKSLTSDREILETVKGVDIPFNKLTCDVLPQDKKEIKFSPEELSAVKSEIDDFLKKEIVRKVDTEDAQSKVVSNIFLRKKTDGSNRGILNLRDFNSVIEKQHFKMDTLSSVLKLVRRDCFQAKLDLKDSYYSVSLKESARKFFRFYLEAELYEFLVLPQGYRESLRIFTKLLKVPLSVLRSLGYLDDIYIQGTTFQECLANLKTTMIMFDNLGFTVNMKKSVFMPSRTIEFWGFIIDSEKMIIYPTERKRINIQQLCATAMRSLQMSIRSLAELIGKLVAVSPGNRYAPIF